MFLLIVSDPKLQSIALDISTLGAVSYTHLDVYKRQVPAMVKSTVNQLFVKVKVMNSKTIKILPAKSR